MHTGTHLLTTTGDCDRIILEVSRRLEAVGLAVGRTFDLQSARAAQAGCACPHHGTARCDCQMIVLLVYAAPCQPLSLVAHGKDGKCWLSLSASPGQKAAAQVIALLTASLAGFPAETIIE